MKKHIYCISKGTLFCFVIFNIILVFAACKDKKTNIPEEINSGNLSIKEDVESSRVTVKEVTDLSNDFYWTEDSCYGSFYCIDYGDNKWVVTANNGRIAYSIDGEKWFNADVDRIFGREYIMALAYGNGKWVAGSVDGHMGYSTDGENWTKADVYSIFDRNIKGVVYGDDKWIAFGRRRSLAYSTDGENWTAVDLSDIFKEENLEIRYGAYGDGKWIVAGEGGKMSYFPDTMAYSTDGINWTEIGSIDIFTNSETNISCIAYDNNMWIAGANNGEMVYSSNGLNWTKINNDTIGIHNILDIAYGDNRWLAVIYNKLIYSVDGKNWIAANHTMDGYNSMNAIAYGDNKWIIVGENMVHQYKR